MGAYRTFLTSRTGIIAGILLFFALSKGYSQSCEVTLRNDTLIDANNLLVDIYVRSTSGTFYYSSGQYKITFNKASILNGGIITGSIVPGFSELTNAAQIPTIVNATASTYWRVITELPASSQATSSQISSTGIGTRICRVQLTNTQPFGQFTADNLLVTTTPYQTAVFYTLPDGTGTPATLTLVNTNLVNPVLNGAISIYNVTGGTTEPSTITVSGSQSDGVVYTLYRNGIAVSTLEGDGSALSFISQPAGTYTVRARRSGTYLYEDMSGTVTVSAACTGVTISSQPSGSTICAGGSASMTVGVSGDSPYTYQWQYYNGASWVSVNNGTPAGAVYTGVTAGTLNISGISTAGSYDYQCYVTNCGGLSNATTASATLIVNSPPSITSTLPGSSCGPGTVTLGATASAGIVNWYAASTGGTSLGTGTSFTTPSLSATTTYYVDATSSGCTTASRTAVTATINTIPTITGTTPGSNCGPGTVTLGAAASAGTINWYAASTGGTSLGTGTSFTTPSLSSTTTYYVDATSNGCTTATRTAITATINTVPAITGTTPGSRCGPGTITLGAVASAGTINWYAASSGGTSLGTGTTFTTPSISATTTYYVDATNGGCTTTSRTSVVAIVNSLPPTPLQTIDCSLGFGQAVVTVTSPLGAGYEYRLDAGTYQTGTTFNAVANGSHTITVRNSAGCTTTGSSFDVSCGCVNPPTVALSSTTGSTCGTTPVTVTNNTFGGSATSITISENGAGTVTPASSNSSPFSFTYTPSAGDAGTIVTITVTTNNPLGAPCAEATATYSLTVNAIPTITGTTPGSNCGPGTVTLGATASAGTINWYAASTGGTSLGTGTSFTTPSLSSTTTYYVDATSNGCTTATRTAVTATINTVPEITGTTPGSRCGPGTVILGATASVGTVNWYAASTGGTSLGTGVSFTTPSISATTTYYADAINGGCTTTSRTAVIATINPLPVVDAGLNQTIPFGTSTFLNASVTGTGLSYSWTPAASLVDATIVDPTTVNLNTTTTFTLTATTSVGCAASDQVTVTVSGSELAASASAAPSTVCAGTSVQLAANATGGSGTYSYSWTSSPGTFTSSSATPTVTPAVTTVYTVVVNDGFNSTSSSVTVTVNGVPPQPTITADGPTTFCQGEDVVLTAPLSVSYLWSNGQTDRSITVTTAGFYTVTVTNVSGCQSTSIPTQVIVNALPSRPNIDPDGTVSICSGSSRTLTSSIGTTYLWSNGATTQSIDAETAGAYTVQVTNSYGCLSQPSLATIIVVNPLPATPTITASGSTAICAGSSVTLTSSISTAYLWSNGATTPSITVNSAGNYSVRVTDANGCQSLTSAVTSVTVSPLPSAPVVGTITQATCSVSTGSVALSGLPATGTWTLTRSPGGVTQTGTGATYTVTGLSEDTYTFTVTNANGCISPASTAVVINTPPAVPTAPVMGTVSQPTCAVTTGSVGISGLPPTGNWTLTRTPGGNTVTGTGITYTLSGIPAGTYTYTVTNAAGCVSPASASITVNAPLPVPAAPVQTVNCDGGFNHAIVTVTSPIGAGLEYRLNSGTWQTSNIFNNVLNGSHTITVRNSSGCTTTGEPFSVNCGCVTPPLLTLGATSGSTCGITAVTVSGNTFGGSATSVTITENGGGTVTPASSTASPFAFTYTPTAADAGRTVIITVTTNNPLGSPCAAASATYTLTVNALPVAPVPGTITHPSCALPTGSVILNSLPASGDWTVTRTPGGQTTTGSGTSTTITGLAPGTYNFTVTNANGCVSASSSNVVINAQPDTPTAPVVGDITQPTCALSTGSVALSGLPSTGTWTLTRIPGNVSVAGTGATRTVSAIPPGTYTFTVANAAGCVSPASAEVVINLQPVTPPAPVIGTITHPTCDLATGSIVIENMPESGEWTLIRYPGGSTSTGTGSSATISSLPAGTYNFAVRNADGCTSGVSANAVINAQPPTPNAPVVGTITQPTFVVGTGSVVLSGLPSSGTWTLIRYPDGFTSQGTGTTRTVSGLEPGTYTFAVTNSVGCTSLPTADVIINARPGAPVVVINNPPTICENETTDLSAPAVTAGSDANLTFTYWTDEAATTAYSTPATAPAGTYYIMGTSTAGYYTIKPVVVTADEIPVANAGLDQVLDYIFGTTLNAEIPEIGTGIWALVSGTGDLFNSVAPSTAVSGLSTGENIFSWTVTNGACDPVTDQVVVLVNDLRIPTLITPNDDGYNDRFELHGIETLGRTELVIFDRRGLKVWESSSYENDWDGRDFNSNPLPEDTYFWVIRADNGVSKSGYIVIRR
jgi:gliding motility-associated-like protein